MSDAFGMTLAAMLLIALLLCFIFEGRYPVTNALAQQMADMVGGVAPTPDVATA